MATIQSRDFEVALISARSNAIDHACVAMRTSPRSQGAKEPSTQAKYVRNGHIANTTATCLDATVASINGQPNVSAKWMIGDRRRSKGSALIVLSVGVAPKNGDTRREGSASGRTVASFFPSPVVAVQLAVRRDIRTTPQTRFLGYGQHLAGTRPQTTVTELALDVAAMNRRRVR
jgi:hypothetical protein